MCFVPKPTICTQKRNQMCAYLREIGYVYQQNIPSKRCDHPATCYQKDEQTHPYKRIRTHARIHTTCLRLSHNSLFGHKPHWSSVAVFHSLRRWLDLSGHFEEQVDTGVRRVCHSDLDPGLIFWVQSLH